MDRVTARAFEYGEGDPALVERLRDAELEYLHMAWDQLPDDDRSAAWQSAIERAETGAMVPLDIRRAARAMERAGSTRVRGRRRGGGGSGGGGRRAAQASQLSTMARDISLREETLGTIPPGMTREQREAELAQFSQRNLQSTWNSTISGNTRDSVRNEDQIETQVRQLGVTLRNEAAIRLAARDMRRTLQGLDDQTVRALLAGQGNVPAGMRSDEWSNTRNAFQNLSMQRGKQLSGAAVSEREREMINEALGATRTTPPSVFRQSIANLVREIDNADAALRASYGDEVVQRYYRNMRRETLRANESAGSSSEPSPAPRAIPGRLAPRPAPAQPAAASNRVTVRINGEERTISRARLERLQAAAGRQGQTIEVVN